VNILVKLYKRLCALGWMKRGVVGRCPYCEERIYVPFMDHCDVCRVYNGGKVVREAG
jgi:uncharacterized protein (DUF983 family)